MTTKTTLGMLLGFAIAAAPVTGQGMHEHGQAGGDSEHEGGMQGMAMMAFMPANVMDAAAMLDLDIEQRTAVGAIQTEAEAQHMEHMQAAMSAGEGACSVLDDGPIDWDEYSEGLSQRAKHMVLAHVTMMRAASEVRAVLTPDQISALEGHDRMSSMDHGAMRGGGGMDHDAMGSGGSMEHEGSMGSMGMMGGNGSMGMMGMMGMCSG
jgi:hypothetical protein